MGSFSLWHWLIVILVIVLLFGGGRISSVMGDVAKGIKSFKRGLADDDEQPAAPQPPQRLSDERPVETRTAASQPTPDLDKS